MPQHARRIEGRSSIPRLAGRNLGRALVACLLVAGMGQAIAQGAFPSRPVKIIVPVTTGGPSDLVARILARDLEASLGRPVVIENRAGASQTVGANAVAKAEPDGHTLLQAAANMAINPFLMSDLPYDTVKDFAPVTLTHLTPYVFVVSAQSPVQTLADLFRFVRENPGKISYGTTGPGSPQQLATLLLMQQVRLPDMAEIQYKGSSAAHPDLIANRVTFMIDPLAAAAPHIKSGLLRALAVTTPQRNAVFPGIPTAIEAGAPGYDFASWGGLFAPAGTPRPVVMRLNEEVKKALTSEALRKRFDDMGLVAKPSSPEEFGQFLQAEMNRWKGLVKKAQ
jgi:tripartite-type tricarboxylate transporter receptor subunit TctC